MKIEFDAISIETKDENVFLKVTESTCIDSTVKIKPHQISMIIDLLRVAATDLLGKPSKAVKK